MKYFLIAGEASGDLHGSNLIHALAEENQEATFQCWGGDLMEKAGATLLKHYRELAFMGFLEVVKNLRTITKNFKECKAQILDFQPDALILIDYPGFNLRLVEWAKQNNLKVFYYISPQLWAWHSSRVKTIKKYVDRMFVILPFEQEFYAKHGVEVDYVGHPLLDVVERFQPDPTFHKTNGLDPSKKIIALLPGSRKQEIKRMLGTMLEVAPSFPDYQFAVAGAPAISRSFYLPMLEKYDQVFLVENQTYTLLHHASAALVTSGTATLETALFEVPQVVCYAGNPASFWLAKRLVNKELKFIGMVNLIAGKEVAKELLQDEFSPRRLKENLYLIFQEINSKKIINEYKFIKSKLGNSGASKRTAKLIVDNTALS